MDFSDKDLQHLKKLCRIECDPQEDAALIEKLNSSIRQIDTMLELGTDGVEPCHHVIEGIVSPMRDDEIADVIPREEFLKNTPDQVGGMIRTPPIMKGS